MELLFLLAEAGAAAEGLEDMLCSLKADTRVVAGEVNALFSTAEASASSGVRITMFFAIESGVVTSIGAVGRTETFFVAERVVAATSLEGVEAFPALFFTLRCGSRLFFPLHGSLLLFPGPHISLIR